MTYGQRNFVYLQQVKSGRNGKNFRKYSNSVKTKIDILFEIFRTFDPGNYITE